MISAAATHDRPCDASCLIRLRHNGNTGRPACKKLGKPCLPPTRETQYCSTTVDQQFTHIAIPCLTYRTELIFAARRVLPRHKPQPSGKVAPRFEEGGISCRGFQCCRDHRTNTWYRHQPTADITGFRPRGEIGIYLFELSFGVVELLDQSCQKCLGNRWDTPITGIHDMATQLREAAGTLCCDKSELCQVSTQCIHYLSTLPHEEFSCSMQDQDTLLQLALHRHEPHVWPLYRLTNRLGICTVILVALNIGANILRGHQFNLMPKSNDFTRPEVSAGTCLHTYEADWQVSEVGQNFRAPQFSGDCDLTVGINAMDLEHALTQIDAYRDSGAHDDVSISDDRPTFKYAFKNGGRPSHHVGNLEFYASLLKRVTDSAFREGEHAE